MASRVGCMISSRFCHWGEQVNYRIIAGKVVRELKFVSFIIYLNNYQTDKYENPILNHQINTFDK